MALTDKLTAIGDAIREKTGGTDPLTLDGMAEAVAGIQAGGGGDADIEDMLVTRTSLTEYSNSRVTTVGPGAFCMATDLESISFPSATTVGRGAFKMNVSNSTVRTALKNVNLPSVVEINLDAFAGCNALENIELPSLERMYSGSAFYSCSSLVSASFPKLTNMNGGSDFYGCSSLEYISMPKIKELGSSASAGKYEFRDCYSLKTVIIPLCELIGYQAFYGCRALVNMELPSVTTISYGAFQQCNSLRAVIIKQTDSVCALSNKNAFDGCYRIVGTVNSTYNPDGLKDGYIYVPDALVEDYKAATNWSTYADQIKPLSEYVEVSE